MTEPRQLSILVVDDDCSFNEDISSYLEEEDFRVVNAYNALEFKERASSVDIIILDIRLPDRPGAQIDTWSGLKALNQLQEKQEEAGNPMPRYLKNVIIRSGHEESEAKKAGIRIPNHSCWLKTYSPLQEIKEALDRLVGQVRAEDAI